MTLPGPERDPYRAAAVEQAWRVAALIDRNPHSPTRGSFSRTHWAWKFSDFPYPRMQEGVHALVCLHGLDEPGNPLRGSRGVEQWVAWGFDYWTSLQHDNGAYDEAYPFEQCLAATAFTSFYVGAAFARWRPSLDAGLANRVERALRRSADWLCAHDETHGLLSNHLGVAVAALEQSARMFDEPRYAARARFFLDRILRHQSAEGWMREYDGADIGYGSHGFFYLAAYWKMTACEQTRDALDRFAGFLSHFIHPDGTIGGEYGSRNTEFYYPAGFEMLAGVSPASGSIAAGLRQAIRARQVCGVWSMDDFNLMPMLNNLFFASDAFDPRASGAPPLPWQTAPFRKYFPEAGLWVVNTPSYYAISALSKGGTVSVFDKAARRMTARHSGLVADAGGRRFTSQDYTLSPPVQWSDAGDAVALAVPWKSLGTTVFGTWLFLAFRLFTVTAGRAPAVSRWVKDTLVKVLIRRKTRASIVHRRRLAATPDGIEIEDDLEMPWPAGVHAVEQFTAIHMGSSLYDDARTFQGGDGVVSWPAQTRLRLRATLSAAGAAWRSLDDHPTQPKRDPLKEPLEMQLMNETPRRAGSVRAVFALLGTLAGLALLLAMNYYLRHTLEYTEQYLFSFYTYFYPKEVAVVFSPATPWWKLLLPIPLFTGVWNTTTLVFAGLLETYLRPATQWYVFNAVVIVASFVTSWIAFRSRVFSFTLAICLGFGTQLYVTYPNSGTISFPLLFVYYELLLLGAYKLIVAPTHRLLWLAVFLTGLLLSALAYEPWLDLLVVVWVMAPYLYVMFGRMGMTLFRRRLVAVAATMTAVGIAHIVIKITLGYGQVRGGESDIILNYPYLAPAIEDFISNVFTNFYMAVSNFLPPSLVTSTSFYQLGGDELVALQHGYHAPFNYLVPMHHVFSWRYYAGIAATLYCFALVHLVRRCWRKPSTGDLVLIVFLLLLGIGGAGPTHSFIKFRPMNAMPVQTYHVLAGVLGAALVISLMLMRAWTRWGTWIGGAAVALAWGVIFYGALARPAMVSHQAAQVGLWTQAYPNPMRALMAKLGRPYQEPAGLALYQLEKHTPAAAVASPPTAVRPFGDALQALPRLAPPVDQWGHPPEVTVTADGGNWLVQGDAKVNGYQLTSPPLPVAPRRTMLVRVNGTIEQGHVCLGVLDETQERWLTPAAVVRQEVVVTTGQNRHITIVFANCLSAPAAPSRFRVETVSYGVLMDAEEGRP